jgi:hypothetical protein
MSATIKPKQSEGRRGCEKPTGLGYIAAEPVLKNKRGSAPTVEVTKIEFLVAEERH